MDWPLSEGEEILWEGQPDGGLSLSTVRHIALPVALVWGVSGVIGAISWAMMDLPGTIWVVVITAAFIALQVIGIALWNRRGRRKLRYAVTNTRIWVHKTGDYFSPTAYTLYDVDAVKVETPPGSVVFGYTMGSFSSGGRTYSNPDTKRLQMIENPERVADLVRVTARLHAGNKPEEFAGSVTGRLFSEFPKLDEDKT